MGKKSEVLSHYSSWRENQKIPSLSKQETIRFSLLKQNDEGIKTLQSKYDSSWNFYKEMTGHLS